MALDGPNMNPAPAHSGEVSSEADLGVLQPSAAVSPSEAPTRRGLPTPPVAASVSPRSAPLGAFAKYELLERLAQGGMGVIFRARDTALDRVVALKKIRSGVWAHAEEIERFRTEARALARLHNPNIIQVSEVGECDGQYYFTMPFAAGGSVAQHLDRYAANPRLAADLMRKVARAVHCAHGRDILHRDLKPSNILLDELGEPLVTDFGLAKFLDADTELTRPGMPIGTPAYMAPEQAVGQTARIGVQSDVWALGVILYELLTGAKPFKRGAGENDLARAICCETPPRPRLLKPALDCDLETIVSKCLQKEPRDRYQTAEALARDLDRWLDGESPTARPVRWPTRVARWIRRNAGRVAVAVLAATAVALLGQGLVAFGPLGPGPSAEVQLRQQRMAYLESIQCDLAARKPVTLVGATGSEKPYPFRLGHPNGVVVHNPGGPLVLESLRLFILPLVPDPGVHSFRLEAEVLNRQLDRTPVGLFIGYSDQPTARGQERCYCLFGFLDQPAHLCHEGVARPTLVTLRPVAQRDKVLPLRTDFLSVGSRNTKVPAPLPKEFPWRKLALEVEPGAIRAFFEGNLMATLAPAELAWTRHLLVAHNAFQRPAPFAFTGRGALGLIVDTNRAEFRNVVLKPVPQR